MSNSMSWEEYRMQASFVCKSCGQDNSMANRCNCTVDSFRSNRLGKIADLDTFKKASDMILGKDGE